jgi:hypothetical protein
MRLLVRPTARLVRRRGPFVALVGVAACAISEQEGGALGNGSFDYNCVTATGAYDAYCPQLGQQAPFPSVIALGSTFSIGYTENFDLNANYPPATVFPVSPDFITLAPGLTSTFGAARPGTPWVFAQISNGQVIDLASINVQPLTSVLVGDTTSTGDHASVGDTHGFSAAAYAGVTVAAGAIPNVLGGANTANVLFTSAGTVTVTVTALGATGSATVQVSK